MHILITGAAGMIGRKLTERLLSDGTLGGRALTQLTLQDVVPPVPPATAIPVNCLTSDLSAPDAATALMRPRPDVVFHLAGVVSGQAEADLALGYAVNLDGTRALWDAIRLAGHRPRVVYASSGAVYGGPFPPVVPDDFAPTPLSSYGAQKLIGELILADYTRREYMDGVGLRLPTICVRPGAPNRAASGFFSNIIRDTLIGQTANLPVPRDFAHFFASPRAAVGFFLHAATMDTGPIGPHRNLMMPGLSCTVADQIAALKRVSPQAAALITEVPDPAIWAIVRTWARDFAATRARDLGFQAETSFDQILAAHIADELGDSVPDIG
jgi:D-erythronate 2-dehydrogenase